MTLLSRALALRAPPLLHSQRVFQALTQTRANIPPSTRNNQPAIVKRQLHSNMPNSPYVVPDSDESDSDDPMLALAIKLSLEQENSQRPQPNGESSLGKLSKVAQGKRKADFIVISDTESDGQSGKEAFASPGGKRKKVVTTGGFKSGGGVSFMGLDRAQMERERLERLSKRMFSSATGAQQRLIWDWEEVKLVRALGGTEAKGHIGKGKGKGNALAYSRTGDNVSNPMNLPFPNGTVKKTWVYDVDEDGTEIKFEEVLGKETLYEAVLSSYQWDHEWIWSKLPNRVMERLVLVMQAKLEVDKQNILRVLGGQPKMDIVFPNMEGLSCMHSKLMLLFHRRPGTGEAWLRVVVPSANLTDYDWGERGTMENVVFLIDLPKLPTPKKSDTQFATSLYNFCEAKGIPLDVLEKLGGFDYSATKGMAFVHSIGGAHYGEEKWKNTGYPGLGTAIKNLGYSSGKDLEVDFVTSSLGATHCDFIINMYNAAMGFDGSGDLARRPPPEPSHPQNRRNLNKPIEKPKKKRKKVEVASDTESDVGIECDEETSWERVKERFRVYYPSRNTVAASKGGLLGGGTICFEPPMWEERGYPKEIVKDCVSVRNGVLLHNKMLFARPAKQLDTPVGKVDAWAYIGSANLSESAWGKLVMCRGKWEPRIKCKNWECGVVVPVIAELESGQTLSGEAPRGLARAEPLGMEVFGSVVPVPMDTPGEDMHPEKRPWFHNEIQLMKVTGRKKRLQVAKCVKYT